MAMTGQVTLLLVIPECDPACHGPGTSLNLLSPTGRV